MSRPVPTAPPCPQWCETDHGAGGWDSVHDRPTFLEVAKWCRRSRTAHGVDVELYRFASWCSTETPQAEVDEVKVLIEDVELAPAQAEQVIEAIQDAIAGAVL